MAPCPHTLSLERSLSSTPISKPILLTDDVVLDSSTASNTPPHSPTLSPTTSEHSFVEDEVLEDFTPFTLIGRMEVCKEATATVVVNNTADTQGVNIATNVTNVTSGECPSRKVIFSTIQIRRYPMILGDNPACRVGAPVSLGWEYEVLPDLSIDDYEAQRQGHRRTYLNHLILNYYQRIAILERSGFGIEQFRAAEKQINRVRRQRAISLALSPFERVEQLAESGAKKVKRCLRRQDCGIKHDQTELECRTEMKKKRGHRGFLRQNAHVQ